MKNKSYKKGFTIIETLVAITILMVAISGPLVFVSGALGQAIYAKDQVTAFYLAQDAMEQIRNVRDTDAIQLNDGALAPNGDPNQWLSGLENCMGGNTCVISAPNAGQSVMDTCPTLDGTVECPVLQYDPNSFVYGYTSPDYGATLAMGTSSIYTRSVQVNVLSPGVEAQVSVTIQWLTQYSNRSFTVVEDLYNWYQ